MPPEPEYDAQLDSAVEYLHGLILDDQWDGDYQSLLKIFSEKDHEHARQDLERAHDRIKRQPKPVASALPEWLEDRFSLVNRVGRGGMADVFLVRDNDSGNNVALKVIHDGQHLGRFRQEASLLQEINSSHIVKVHELIESSNADSQGAAIVMDYVEGKDLGKMIRRREEEAEFTEVVIWMCGIAQAMIDVSRESITHRDIKPSNILIRESDNVALLADFGLATDRNSDEGIASSRADMTKAGTVLGTASYMSPEQVRDSKAADVRNDIYGFGATFYHVCTGTAPHVGEDWLETLYKVRHEPLTSPVTHNPSIPPNLVLVLETALAKKARDRFQTFEELKSQLEIILASSDSLAAANMLALDCPEELPPSAERDARDAGQVRLADQEIRRYQRYQVESRMLSEAPMTPEFGPGPEIPVARRRFANGKELQIVVGDIVEQGQACEVIVSSDDGLLRMNAGVSKRIKQAAGSLVPEEAQRFVPVQAGRVIVTSAGNLPQRMIFHAITLALPISQMEGNYIPTTDLIRNILDSCCYHVESSQIKSIIFPLLGTGIAGMDAQRCLETMVEYLVRELEEGITPLQEARIVVLPGICDELGPAIDRLL